MSKIIGRLVDLGVAVEGTRGTGEVITNMIPKSDITFDDKVLKARSAVGYGVINLEGNQALVARKHSEGSIDFDMHDKTFGLFLVSLLGAVSTGAQADQAFPNTLTLENNNQHPSLSLLFEEQTIGNLSFRLCMIETLSITIIPDDVVKVTATFMGRHSAVGGSSNLAYEAESKFLGRHLSFKIETLTSGLDAGTNIPVRSLTLNFEKNLRLVHNSGTVEPEDIVNQGFRVTGEVEMDYQNRTFADLMNDGSLRAVRIQLVNEQVTIGAGSTNPEFRLDLSSVDFSTWEAQRPNDELTAQTFQFMALFDTVNGDVINDCRLVNAHDGTDYV